jgi:hypothetical protein
MMLAQFQKLYPTGCIISEFLQIHEGKCLVRVKIEIDGVTRATGMAADLTLEGAEDKARDRALLVLGIQPNKQPETPLPPPPTRNQPNSESFPLYSSGVGSEPPIESTGLKPKTSSFQSTSTPLPKFDNPEEYFGNVNDNQTFSNPNPAISYSNVTQFVPRQSNPQENLGAITEKTAKEPAKEPVNHSDTIAKIDVQMERLGWTTEQGREYLKQTYGKRARSLLSDEELHDFLRYLESQPTPIDPSMGF